MQAVQKPNRLVLSRLNPDKPTFHKSVTNAKYVSTLYDTLSQLHPFPRILPLTKDNLSANERLDNLKKHHTCPFATGIEYSLVFYQDNTLVTSVVWKPWGVCTTVSQKKGNIIEQLDASSVNQILMNDITHLFNIDTATINCINLNKSTHSLSC